MIRVLLVDDHPAIRAGLHAVMRLEPGLVPVGEAASASAALQLADRVRPEVVVVDYHLPDEDGLTLCWRLKRLPVPSRVLIYSAFVEARLGVVASMAGADGLLDKSAPPEELFEAIRRLARGERDVPAATPEVMEATAQALDAEDLPIFSMLLNRVPTGEAARTLRLEQRDLEHKALRIISRLRV